MGERVFISLPSWTDGLMMMMKVDQFIRQEMMLCALMMEYASGLFLPFFLSLFFLGGWGVGGGWGVPFAGAKVGLGYIRASLRFFMGMFFLFCQEWISKLTN